jgi:hypothetical protein
MAIKTKSAAPKGAKKPPTPEPAGVPLPGITPLDVMLDVMRTHHAAGALAEALAAAKAAARFFYAQCKNTEQRDAIDPESVTDDELRRRISELVATLDSLGGVAGYRIVPDRADPPAGT